MDNNAEFASRGRRSGEILAGRPPESGQPPRAPVHAPAIIFDHVTVAYGRGRKRSEALRNFNLRIARGETVALLGPSGSGKSTALKALAGFVRPVFGTVRLDGEDVTDLPPAKRGIGVVVQSYALFPHMRVRDNVAFGLRARRTKSDRIAECVDDALAMVSMSAYADRYPRELSGGQQQRVAIARALAIRPRVLLLDEPLAALDAQLRLSMIAELRQLQQSLPDTAMLYVTHDQSEALALADRIAVMRDAELVDVDSAHNLWTRPPTDFTANFLGGANLIPCTVGRVSGESALVSVGDKMLSVTAPTPEIGRDPWAPGASALICIRPHTLSIVGPTAPGALRAGSEQGVARCVDQGVPRSKRAARPTDRCGGAGARRRSTRFGCRCEVPRTSRSARRSTGGGVMIAVLDRVDSAGAQPRRKRRRAVPVLWAIPPLLVVLVAIVYPLLRVLSNSAEGEGNSTWRAVLGSTLFQHALLTTVYIAVLTTIGCLALGTFLATVLAFVPFPGSELVGRLIDTVLALPSFLITLAFTFLYGAAGAVNALIANLTGGSRPLEFLSSPAGVILAETTFFTPFVVRPLLAAFAIVPREQLDVAASLGASPWRVLAKVVMPEAWPALMAGGSLVLLLALNEFGIVLFTGAKEVVTLPVLIYTRGIVTFDLLGAAVIATIQIVLSLALYGLYRIVFSRMLAGRANSEPKGA